LAKDLTTCLYNPQPLLLKLAAKVGDGSRNGKKKQQLLKEMLRKYSLYKKENNHIINKLVLKNGFVY